MSKESETVFRATQMYIYLQKSSLFYLGRFFCPHLSPKIYHLLQFYLFSQKILITNNKFHPENLFIYSTKMISKYVLTPFEPPQKCTVIKWGKNVHNLVLHFHCTLWSFRNKMERERKKTKWTDRAKKERGYNILKAKKHIWN